MKPVIRILFWTSSVCISVDTLSLVILRSITLFLQQGIESEPLFPIVHPQSGTSHTDKGDDKGVSSPRDEAQPSTSKDEDRSGDEERSHGEERIHDEDRSHGEEKHSSEEPIKAKEEEPEKNM